MQRFVNDIKENPKIILSIIALNLKNLFYRFRGVKTVVYNLHHLYFYDNFRTIFSLLKSNKKIRVYFSYNYKNELLHDYLIARTEAWRVISSNISPYVSFDLFICPEITGPDFPLSFLKTRKLELYHGMGIYPMYSKLDVLTRFDAHFAIGSQYKPFLNEINKLRKTPAKIYEVGYPKLDLLKSDLGNVAGNDHEFLPNPVILYTPHWNPTGSIHQLGIEFLEEMAGWNFQIIIKPHNYLYFEFADQNWKQQLTDLAVKYEKVEFITDPDTQKLYTKADLMITDPGTTSSLEFSLLQRPLLIYDAKNWFELNSEHEIELEYYRIAFKFRNTVELKTLILRMIENSMNEEIEQQRKEQFELSGRYLYNFGTATNIGYNAILHELRMD